MKTAEKIAREIINNKEVAKELDAPTRMWLEQHIIAGIINNKKQIDNDELWDKHSVSIGTDIDDLQYYAGRIMMTREEFNKMMLSIFG